MNTTIKYTALGFAGACTLAYACGGTVRTSADTSTTTSGGGGDASGGNSEGGHGTGNDTLQVGGSTGEGGSAECREIELEHTIRPGLPCDLEVVWPRKQPIDWNIIDVAYLVGGITPEWLEDVGSELACGLNDHAYWVDTMSAVVHLCPATCDRVTADPMADLSVHLDCGIKD